MTFTANASVAQKGPLVRGSTVTVEELSATLATTGPRFTYQTDSELGTFTPNAAFTSQYVGVTATGNYFDEVTGALSDGPVTLNAYGNLSQPTTLNANVLTTLAYRRIQTLISSSNLTFTAAQAQAESEVLAALGIPAGDYGRFSSLDIGKAGNGDRMLAAVSSLFSYGNTSANLAALLTSVQQDIATNGRITSNATTTTLRASMQALDGAAIAANLNQRYAAAGVSYSAADIVDWLDQDGDGVSGRLEFRVPQATQSSEFTIPASVVAANAGRTISVENGRLMVNGAPVAGTVQLQAADVVTVAPLPGAFPAGLAQAYLMSGATRLIRVSFVSELTALTIAPAVDTLPKGSGRYLAATGAFSDGTTADLTSVVTWRSSAPHVATINSAGLAAGVAEGATTITATSGNVTSSLTLTITGPAISQLSLTPKGARVPVGGTRQFTANARMTDLTMADVTARVTWTSSDLSIATVTGGVVTGVSGGSVTITASSPTASANVSVVIASNTWEALAVDASPRTSHTATLLQDGRVFVAMGAANGVCCNTTSRIYDPATNIWSDAAPALYGVMNHAAARLPNGRVMLIGGDSSGGAVSTTQIYDPVANTWAAGPSMAYARQGHKAVETRVNGRVFVVGGGAPPELFDPNTFTWTPKPAPFSVDNVDSATMDNSFNVVIISGTDVREYQAYEDTWRTVTSMNMARPGHAAVAVNNELILVIGSATTGAQIYNSTVRGWAVIPSPANDYTDATATLLTDGTVLVVSSSIAPTPAKAEIFNWNGNTWTPTPDLQQDHQKHTATLLPNGQVLIIGASGHSTPELYQ